MSLCCYVFLSKLLDKPLETFSLTIDLRVDRQVILLYAKSEYTCHVII